MGHVARNPGLLHANNKGADQTAHTRSLISACVIRFCKSIVSELTTRKISIHQLVSVAEQAGMSLTWSEAPKTDFLASRPNYYKMYLEIEKQC